MNDEPNSGDWWQRKQAHAIRVTCPTCDHVEWVIGKPGEVEPHVECHGCLRARMEDE